MDELLMRRRVEGARVGHLSTTRADGRPHVVPCCFVLSESVVFTAVDAKPKTTTRLQRIRNLESNSGACLVVDHYEDEDWSRLWWVRIDATARLLGSGDERDGALALLRAKYSQYEREPPPGPVVALDIAAWSAWP